MAKPKRKKKKPGGSGPPPAPDRETILGDLDARLAELQADPEQPGPIWGAAHQLLLKAKVDPADVISVIASRDVDGLGRAIRTLRGGFVPEHMDAQPSGAAHVEIPADTLRRAMRAFRKRVKLTKLDHESRLSVSPMTSGKQADFDAIMAPHQYPTEVWEALAEAGELKRVGRGFYMLAEGG